MDTHFGRPLYWLAIALTTVFLLKSETVQAETDGNSLNGTVEFQPIISCAKGGGASLGINFSITKQMNDYLNLGGGLGIAESSNFKTKPSIPIFLRLGAENSGNDFTPFATMDMGALVSTQNAKDGSGFLFNPTVGVKYSGFSLGLGYYGIFGKHTGHSINIRLGYTFGIHKTKGSEKMGALASAIGEAFKNAEFSIEPGFYIPLGGRTSFYDSFGDYAPASGKPLVGYGLDLSYLFTVNKQLALGLTAGLNFQTYKEDLTFRQENHHITNLPIAIRTKYKFTQWLIGQSFTPFARFDVGVNTGDEVKFHWSPGIGLSYGIRDGKSSIDLALSYTPSSYEQRSTNNLEDVKFGFLRIGLGYTF